jgi:hypothetical protein
MLFLFMEICLNSIDGIEADHFMSFFYKCFQGQFIFNFELFSFTVLLE